MGCCGSHPQERSSVYQPRYIEPQKVVQRQIEPVQPKVQQRQLMIPIQRPQPIYQEAVAFLNQEKYHEALDKFLQVKRMSPQYPNIEESIFICIVYMKILQIYQEGIIFSKQGQQLFQRGNFEEAIKRFDYIENCLQSDYKDVPRYINACRQGIWKQRLQMVLIQVQVTEAIEELQRMQRFFQLMTLLQQQEQRKVPNPSQKRMEQNNKNPDYNQMNLDCVKIYSDCFKEPQCPLRNNSRPFRHQKCQSLAYFHASGQVSCEAKCQTYQLRDACFICSNSLIRKIELQSDKFRNEIIKDEQWLAKFVEFCLLKGNYSEGQKWNFREKITCGAYLQFLQN